MQSEMNAEPPLFSPIHLHAPETTPLASFESDTVPLLGSPSISTLVAPTDSIVIAVTDATRSSPDRILVGGLLRILDDAGVARERITLLCATGLHRPMTKDEARDRLGDENLRGITFINHDARDGDGLIDLGTIDGIPLITNRRCVEADLLIAVGVVEPHQYAGYSGGGKTVVIGCGGEATIGATHGLGMLERTGVELGAIEGNPFQQFVRAATKRVGLRYVVNVALDGRERVIAAACGDPIAVHDRLAAEAARISIIEVDRLFPAALIGMPSSKASNLYQATRGATYLAESRRSPLLPGAPIILRADIPEGAGRGVGEKRFVDLLRSASSPTELLARLRRDGVEGGAQRAFIVARTLERHPIIVAGSGDAELIGSCGMIPVGSVEEGIARAAEIVGRGPHHFDNSETPEMLVVSNGIGMVARVFVESV